MIVEQFIQWVTTADVEKRAQATNALARAYLTNSFESDDVEAAESAMTFVLDDPEEEVRYALAKVVAPSAKAPRHVILGLLDDVSEVGALVARTSPLLIDSELVDIVASRPLPLQLAVAMRVTLSVVVTAAIAEVAPYAVCIRLVTNPGAEFLPSTFVRLAERFGSYDEMQQDLLVRENLPVAARQFVLANMSNTLCAKAVQAQQINPERADTIAREARDRATLTLARNIDQTQICELVEHLRDSMQLTPLLLLRAICAGQIQLFMEALALLCDKPTSRIMALLNDNSKRTLRTLYLKAGLPVEAYSAFSIAFEVYLEQGSVIDPRDQYRFTRTMIERILERYKSEQFDGAGELLSMLRRFSSETARDAAREYIVGKVSGAKTAQITDSDPADESRKVQVAGTIRPTTSEETNQHKTQQAPWASLLTRIKGAPKNILPALSDETKTTGKRRQSIAANRSRGFGRTNRAGRISKPFARQSKVA